MVVVVVGYSTNSPKGNEKKGNEITEKSSEFLQRLFRVVSGNVLVVETRAKNERYCQLDPSETFTVVKNQVYRLLKLVTYVWLVC